MSLLANLADINEQNVLYKHLKCVLTTQKKCSKEIMKNEMGGIVWSFGNRHFFHTIGLLWMGDT